MNKKDTRCYRLGAEINCIYCNGRCKKNGKASTSRQRYKCLSCNKVFLSEYRYMAYNREVNNLIVKLIKEGCGIRSTARLLKISATTVLKRILSIAKSIAKPLIAMGKEYELDELCTYVRKKTNQLWVAYAIRKDTREVTDFIVGRRINNTLKRVTNTLILSDAIKVYTDKLKQYNTLLPYPIHCTKHNGTNHIERKKPHPSHPPKTPFPPNDLFFKKHCFSDCVPEDIFLELK